MINENTGKWERVSRSLPCPICGKPDWCMISSDRAAVLCARTESPKRIGNAGWLHLIGAQRPIEKYVRAIPLLPGKGKGIDFAALTKQSQEDLDAGRLMQLSSTLGLTEQSLKALSIGWYRNWDAYSFPMRDADGNIIGIRLRGANGSKWAVKESKEGLFLPNVARTESRLLVCEGASDTAALLDFGFSHVVGRPSCQGGTFLLIDLVHKRRPSLVVIITDNDTPGIQGANSLADNLIVHVPEVRIIRPAHYAKDIREWLRCDGKREDVEAAISDAIPRRLEIRTEQKGVTS